ncbi:uridine kinase [Legionella cardiaca]|uniref:Uridine kinase n=1 Tax=Legionella cardiaca TaxID=1071983 RepID=A0ABY8AR08_9GAMM|nr:uridine kinase [Legionella cardiaca]WED43128.1 uridine kinase [Legionella cardiaca]
MKVQIIGISGISGAGKTTLTKALAKILKGTRLHWDEFDSLGTGPEDYRAWYDRGQNYTEWNYESLAKILQTLKENNVINHPALGKMLLPTPYIIFDAPLGRLHQQTGIFIDVCIHITLPLDVSLGRRIIRDFKAPDKSKEELLEELDFYLKHSRKLFFDEELQKNADLIIDGLLDTATQMKHCVDYLENKFHNGER